MKGSSERWPKRWLNDDHFLNFWVLTDTSPQRELQNDFLAGKKLFLFHCCCCFFFCCCLFCCFCFCYCFFSITCSFHVHNTKPSGTMGGTQKTMTISATSFRGCKWFSPSFICLYYVYIYIYIEISLRISCDSKPTFSWNQKNGSLIPNILFGDISKADSFPSPTFVVFDSLTQELRLMVKGLVGGFRFLVNSVTHGESS